MKAGNLVLLLIVLLIAFGFLFKDDLEIRKQQRLVQDQIDDLNRQLEDAQALLAACQQKSSQDEDTIQQLQATIGGLEAANQELNRQLTDLSIKAAILESQGSFVEFLNSNPVLLFGALLVQLATGAIRYANKLGLRSPKNSRAASDEYIRLSLEERALILNRRRNGKSRMK